LGSTGVGGRSVRASSARNSGRRAESGVSGASTNSTRAPWRAKCWARWCLLKRVGPNHGGADRKTKAFGRGGGGSANRRHLAIDSRHSGNLPIEREANFDAAAPGLAHARATFGLIEQAAYRGGEGACIDGHEHARIGAEQFAGRSDVGGDDG